MAAAPPPLPPTIQVSARLLETNLGRRLLKDVGVEPEDVDLVEATRQLGPRALTLVLSHGVIPVMVHHPGRQQPSHYRVDGIPALLQLLPPHGNAGVHEIAKPTGPSAVLWIDVDMSYNPEEGGIVCEAAAAIHAYTTLWLEALAICLQKQWPGPIELPPAAPEEVSAVVVTGCRPGKISYHVYLRLPPGYAVEDFTQLGRLMTQLRPVVTAGVAVMKEPMVKALHDGFDAGVYRGMSSLRVPLSPHQKYPGGEGTLQFALKARMPVRQEGEESRPVVISLKPPSHTRLLQECLLSGSVTGGNGVRYLQPGRTPLGGTTRSWGGGLVERPSAAPAPGRLSVQTNPRRMRTCETLKVLRTSARLPTATVNGIAVPWPPGIDPNASYLAPLGSSCTSCRGRVWYGFLSDTGLLGNRTGEDLYPLANTPWAKQAICNLRRRGFGVRELMALTVQLMTGFVQGKEMERRMSVQRDAVTGQLRCMWALRPPHRHCLRRRARQPTSCKSRHSGATVYLEVRAPVTGLGSDCHVTRCGFVGRCWSARCAKATGRNAMTALPPSVATLWRLLAAAIEREQSARGGQA